MPNNNIYFKLLEEKVITKNKYYNIYLKLIEKALSRKNKNFKGEIHHIFPSAFCKNDIHYKKDKNNLVKLTYREHFIAHRLLSKLLFISIEDQRLMNFAVSCFMKNKEVRGINSRQFKIAKAAISEAKTGVPLKIDIKNKLSEKRRGKCVFYDHEGNHYYLEINDPLIKEFGLFGNRKNTVLAKDSEGNIISINSTDDRLKNGKLVGIMKGKSTYKSKNGELYTLDTDSPLIKELDLVHINTGRKFKLKEGANAGEKNPMHGRTQEVCCFDLQEKVFLRISKKLFDSDSRYVGVNNKIAKQYRKQFN